MEISAVTSYNDYDAVHPVSYTHLEYTADELLEKACRYRSYWGSKGGITVSGGEPLLQIDFLTELFRKAKKLGIHTTLDTLSLIHISWIHWKKSAWKP